MPYRLRAAFNPALLGAYLASFPFLPLIVFVKYFFYRIFFCPSYFIADNGSGRSSPRCGKARQNARRDRVCLEFLVLFVQAKRTLNQANWVCSDINHDVLTGLRPLFMFFCLDTKEPTKSRMPYRLRAAFNPALLGAYFSGGTNIADKQLH